MPTPTATAPAMKGGKASSRFLIVLVIALAGLSYYLFSQNAKLKADPQERALAETNRLVSQVSKFIVLPEEQPTVATVTDIEKLKDQPFFAHAKNGDKVLIYTEAKKAILFDPVAGKIVDVAPINIGNANNTQSAPKTPTQSAPTTESSN